jgi:uncharacterized lipoprotein YmbA
MRDSFVSVTFRMALGICLLLLVGCASSPPQHYYVLSPLAEGKALTEDSCISLGVGPVSLPEYVNRLQIVVRASQDELIGSGFELWAEPLSESVPRTIAEDLSQLVCTREVLIFPWASSRMPDYRVEVNILRFDGTIGGTVSLEAWWAVFSGAEKKPKTARKATYQEPAAGSGYMGLVQAYSRAVGALSQDVAAALKQVGAK